MKTVNKIKQKNKKTIKKPNLKNKKEKVLIVAQEIKFARLLSGNEKKTRDRVLKTFKKWLLSCFEKGYEFKEDDFTRVWKGLFYAVWMSDKPLVQEELCETIASILDLFPPDQVKYALLMTKAGLKVLATEWYGIDQHRLDKFLMLVRRYLRGSLRVLKRCEWSLPACKLYADMLTSNDGLLSPRTPLYARNAGSMLMHFVDCFLEELAKVSAGAVPATAVTALLRPFCVYTCSGADPALCVACRRLLTALLRQTDQGLSYEERTRAWKQMGCPRGGPDALEPVSDEEEADAPSDDEWQDDYSGPTALDPRAGRVDVELASLPVDATGMASTLKGLLATAGSKAHKRTKICLERFEQLAKDEYPLKVEDVRAEIERDSEPTPTPTPTRAARRLRALEKGLVAASDELALRGLSRKHRKRVLARTRSGIEPGPDITSTNGDWAVESTESKTAEKKISKHKLNHANKENVHKERKAKKPKLDVQTDKSKAEILANKHKIQENDKTTNDDQMKSKNSENIQVVIPKILNNKIQDKLVSKKQEKQRRSNEKTKNTEIVTEKVKLQDKSNNKLITHDNKMEKLQKDKKLETLSNDKVKLQVKNQKNNLQSKEIRRKGDKIQKRNDERSQKKFDTPKKVKFVLKNNSMQGTIDYYKSVRQSPNIPYDGTKKPIKTNLKPSTPSPLNPFAKKKLRLKSNF